MAPATEAQLNCSSFRPNARPRVGAEGGVAHVTTTFVTLALAMVPLPLVTEQPSPEGGASTVTL